MEFGNSYYYEVTTRQRHRELLQEAESYRLLKQANLPQEASSAWLMFGIDLVEMLRSLTHVKHFVNERAPAPSASRE
jgi:hypothetical protein